MQSMIKACTLPDSQTYLPKSPIGGGHVMSAHYGPKKPLAGGLNWYVIATTDVSKEDNFTVLPKDLYPLPPSLESGNSNANTTGVGIMVYWSRASYDWTNSGEHMIESDKPKPCSPGAPASSCLKVQYYSKAHACVRVLPNVAPDSVL